MSIETWLLFVIASIIIILSPGPAILLTINNSLRFGTKTTTFSAAGNAFGVVLLGLAICFGLGSLLSASALAFTVIKLIGAVYLVYLGLKVWFNSSSLDFETNNNTQQKSRAALFSQGVLLAITNPKGLVLLTALFPQFINVNQPAVPQILILTITLSLLCFLAHVLLAATSGRIKTLFLSQKRLKMVRRFIGGSFIGFGAALAISSR